MLNKALEINAKNVPSLNELAIIYKEEGNFTEAKNVLNKALEINAKNVPSLNELAIVYKEEGNFTEAKRIVEKGLKLEPNNQYFKRTLKEINRLERNPPKPEMKSYNRTATAKKLRDLVAEGNLKEVLTTFSNEKDLGKLKNNVIGLLGRYNFNEQQSKKSVLKHEDYILERSRINTTVLDYIDEYEKGE